MTYTNACTQSSAYIYLQSDKDCYLICLHTAFCSHSFLVKFCPLCPVYEFSNSTYEYCCHKWRKWFFIQWCSQLL